MLRAWLFMSIRSARHFTGRLVGTATDVAVMNPLLILHVRDLLLVFGLSVFRHLLLPLSATAVEGTRTTLAPSSI